MNRERAAELIWDAWLTGKRLEGLPDDARPGDLADGMAAQAALAELAGPVSGWKIGATTVYARQYLGVPGPLAGAMFERFHQVEGAPVPADTMTMGVAEPEFAFRLKADPGLSPSLTAVLDAVDTMFLAIELPDSRYTDHRHAGGPQLLADAACSGRFVEGRPVPGWRTVDLPRCQVVLHADGEEFSRGSGSLVLGDPRLALHWLAMELPRHGRTLCPGDIVTTGTATPPCPIRAGSHVVADFGELGSVEARFCSPLE
ncbi:hydratase/decarboxylase [Amycolatopsis mediterranei S699]|uniref:Hydratase/decarboxylase n=2 Tax=Amycolatopsis mediterranei TaxID=33910 RepID=A0A9R0U6Y9_AMYMS|nr:fumarylacetoacetate hydrolase family protein [Amycolatopsis mediterranei]ADJ43362.1 putative hydratase/decarboxylase [Amycolatopsis mediterranei U32]AEK40063.1 hydratase/decarboxylase [Amycolatopsis mediterranei S699]AFO75075.1 hydratase/decarboxylase [Amycolatopsis mediterranei S699]AGT82204.1 hydratase/decarboxylase [Amycolatopsis mediterranei RB]KDO11732.1 hydratase [Amycolatopsis mediterranei]